VRLGAQFAGAGLAAAACIILAACGIYTPKNFNNAARPSVAKIGEELASVKFDRVNYTLHRGQEVGHFRGGQAFTGCGPQLGGRPVFWAQGPMVVRDEELEQLFYQEMRAANYNVLGDPSQMFSDVDAGAAKPDYLIGARVDSVDMDLCDVVNLWNIRPLGVQKGSGLISVTWQVFSTLERKVVLEIKTQGSGVLDEPAPDGGEIVLGNAFASAAANLAADAKFHDLLAGKPAAAPSAAMPSAASKLTVARLPQFTDAIASNVARIERSVVTVLTGEGHGSGFFISPTLLLTNHHVAGGTKRVKLKFVDGTEIYATVLRSRADRDVALLEVEAGSYEAIPIRGAGVNITEEVYAVGSPLDESLSGTVTRGIVSQIKTDERGQALIQADASVQPGNSGGPLLDKDGNVVGIAVAGMVDQADSSVGINFFIPIGDALTKLNISLN
jgi:serine protease Do